MSAHPHLFSLDHDLLAEGDGMPRVESAAVVYLKHGQACDVPLSPYWHIIVVVSGVVRMDARRLPRAEVYPHKVIVVPPARRFSLTGEAGSSALLWLQVEPLDYPSFWHYTDIVFARGIPRFEDPRPGEGAEFTRAVSARRADGITVATHRYPRDAVPKPRQAGRHTLLVSAFDAFSHPSDAGYTDVEPFTGVLVRPGELIAPAHTERSLHPFVIEVGVSAPPA